MHDDDRLNSANQENEKDLGYESYWTEAEWEEHLIENEKLLDRYEAVWSENPTRKWEDPVDLFMKAYHGIDLGEDLSGALITEEAAASAEEPTALLDPSRPDLEESAAASQDAILKELDSITAYPLALEFSTSVLDFVQKYPAVTLIDQPLHRELSFNGLRIAAEIAGGHGLGYDEQGLCGNIVKNRWALKHVFESKRILQVLISRDFSLAASELKTLLERLSVLETELEHRISDLRSKVWW